MYLQLIGLLKSAVELVASVDEQDDSYHGLDPECTETSGINLTVKFLQTYEVPFLSQLFNVLFISYTECHNGCPCK